MLTACSSKSDTDDNLDPETDESMDPNPDYQVINVENSGGEPFDLKLTLSDTSDVYFVFTNPSTDELSLPEVIDLSKNLNTQTTPEANNMFSQATSRSSAIYTNSGTEIIKGSPWVTEWNEYLLKNVLPLVPNSGGSKGGGEIQPQFNIVDGSGYSLFDSENNPEPLDATCRLVRTVETGLGLKTLNIWVADNCWEIGGDRAFNVTREMIEALADKFLNDAGMDDDIYDWVTNLYGEEWSSYNYNNVIPVSDEITIFLYDINDDNSTRGGYIGMFHSKDNFVKDYWYNNPDENYDENMDATRFSNERIMFYLDSVLFATPQNDPWHPGDYWAQEIFSTLAHEFQHMIHFNIKAMAQDKTHTEILLNEMMSLCTEDILADKIGITGPRGVAGHNPSAGLPDNLRGNLCLHNVYLDFPFLYWPVSDEEPIRNWAAYSNKYAFGAYLMRNYKPATFLNSLMHSQHSDYRAVEDAIPGSESIGQLYAKSGIAYIISDLNTNLKDDKGYVLNTGSWFSERFGNSNITYRLGSINMYNYNYANEELDIYQKGPYFYTTSPVGNENNSVFMPLSNLYYKLGEGLSGNVSSRINMQPGSMLTVVVKKHNK